MKAATCEAHPGIRTDTKECYRCAKEAPVPEETTVTLPEETSPRPFVDLDLADVCDWALILTDCGPYDGAIVRVRYEATPEEARAVDHAGIRRALYAAGALLVHGPIATIRHAVTEAAPTLTEETDVYSGWTEYADRLGLSDHDRVRLDRKVCEALEVTR